MKYLHYCPYSLHTHFESPLWEFFNNEKNEETIHKIIETWMEPKILLGNIFQKDVSWQMDYVRAKMYGLPMDLNDTGDVFVSGVFMVAKRIIDLSSLRFKDYIFEEGIVARILLGTMVHEYNTIGEDGERLYDELQSENDLAPDTNHVKSNGVAENRTHMIPLYTEFMGNKVYDAYKFKYFMLKDIWKGKNIFLEKADLFSELEPLHLFSDQKLKFSKEGIDGLKKKGLEDRFIKGFQQIRITRKFDSNPIYFLMSLVASVICEDELFLCFDPFYYDICICDKNALFCRPQSINCVINLKGLIGGVFCSGCIGKMFGSFKISKDKILDPNTVKALFDHIYSLIDGVHLDDLEIQAYGKVHNELEYQKIKENLPHSLVGNIQYDSQYSKPGFFIKKDLKSFRKSLKKK